MTAKCILKSCSCVMGNLKSFHIKGDKYETGKFLNTTCIYSLDFN